LQKLSAYGVDVTYLKIFQNYLSDRTQFVEINGFKSCPLCITHGVPQGSILGPLLFLAFINDLPPNIPNSIVDVYADDTTFSSSSHFSVASTELQVNLQHDIDKLCQWSDKNRMVLNADKTKSILITGKRLKSRMQLSSLPLIASDSNIELVSSQKLLGVIIDEDLNFKEHINKLSKNLSKKIGLLRKIRRYLSLLERKLFYNAVVKPVMMYGSSIWSCCSRNDLLRIFKLQKRAARIILGTDTSSRSMANFNILRTYLKQTMKLMVDKLVMANII
jgi:hypothetical protein